MTNSPHKKIAVIGNAGSGKTTLAFQLHEQLKLPLHHLDQYHWLPNWEKVGSDKFTVKHEELCKTDAWIMEGIYFKFLPQRVAHADVVIFLDTPRYLCMWRVIKRSVLHWGEVIPGNPAGCKQRLFSFGFLEFLKWVWDFNARHRATILDILNDAQSRYGQSKQIYILKSLKEIPALVQQLELHDKEK